MDLIRRISDSNFYRDRLTAFDLATTAFGLLNLLKAIDQRRIKAIAGRASTSLDDLVASFPLSLSEKMAGSLPPEEGSLKK